VSPHRPAPRRLTLPLERLTSEMAPATTLARVQAIWEQATGPQISAAARPTKEHEGVLTVSCSSAVWAQEIDLMSSTLIEQVNRALHSDLIQQLRCRTD
jgi:predicted nucleic acid-binding Zn ribbon protein